MTDGLDYIDEEDEIKKKTGPIPATEEMKAIADELKSVAAFHKKCEKRSKELRNKLSILMFSHEVLFCPETGADILTWAQGSDRSHFDTAKFKEKYPEIYKEFTSMKAGNKTLLLK